MDTFLGVEVECIHCGTYPVTREQAAQLYRTSMLRGFQCFQCDEEVHVLVNGKRASMLEVWDATEHVARVR